MARSKTPSAEAYRQFNEQNGQWISYTWEETHQRVMGCVQALSLLNLERGARIAILLPNGLQAVCIDQAALQMACRFLCMRWIILKVCLHHR
jgi:long-chain acyl-CoA synthetase